MSMLELRLVALKCVRFFSTERPIIRKPTLPYFLKLHEHLIINQSLRTNDKIDNEKWKIIRKELCDSKNLSVTIHNVDSAIVGRCCEANNSTAALDYIKFLKTTNHELNIATIGKYFSLIYEREEPLSSEEINTIFELYDKLRANYPFLDARTAEYCILALSMTKRWKECMELLTMIEYTDTGRGSAYNSIVVAAFNNDEYDIGWDYMKLMPPKLPFNKKLLKSYLDYAIRNTKNVGELEILINKMFEFWSEHDIYPPLEDANMYMNYLKNTGKWKFNTCTIHSNGICSECGNRLSKFNTSQQEFNHLLKTFSTKVLMGEDIYNNTTPEELEQFKQFVETTKPYDVVIDGLNAAYSLQQSKGNRNRAMQLKNIVSEFVKKNKRIFVLGRIHMRKWPESEMNYVKRNTHLFLANDLTRDDVYFLYAALASGVKTFFCSRDFMRQHKFHLDEDSQKIFRRWQLTRQIQPIYIGGLDNKQLVLLYPPQFLPTAQKDLNGNWHIPYQEGSKKQVTPSNLPKFWICLSKTTNTN